MKISVMIMSMKNETKFNYLTMLTLFVQFFCLWCLLCLCAFDLGSLRSILSFECLFVTLFLICIGLCSGLMSMFDLALFGLGLILILLSICQSEPSAILYLRDLLLMPNSHNNFDISRNISFLFG